MFTGIIQAQIKLKNIKRNNDILLMGFEFPEIKNSKLILGGSVSLNGICSTISSISKSEFGVGYMRETINKTTVGEFASGDILNFENSLKIGDGLDGHFVYGHIDCVGKIKSIKQEGSSKVLEISIPKEFLKYVVYKGSIAIDGVSLTVSKKNKNSFEVSLIPYTLSKTNLDKKVVGDNLNIETDALGKYVLGRIKN
jgi:riboflavin synthase